VVTTPPGSSKDRRNSLKPQAILTGIIVAIVVGGVIAALAIAIPLAIVAAIVSGRADIKAIRHDK